MSREKCIYILQVNITKTNEIDKPGTIFRPETVDAVNNISIT